MADPVAPAIVPPANEPPPANPNAQPAADAADAKPEPNPAQKSRAISREIAEKRLRQKAEAEAKKAREDAQAAQLTAEAATRRVEAIKADPLTALADLGLTYEELTKRAIAQRGANTPQARIEALETKVKQDEERRANEAKQQTEHALADDNNRKVSAYLADAWSFAKAGKESEYELLAGEDPDAAQQMIFVTADNMARESSKTPTHKQVCDAVEAELMARAQRWSKAKKIAAAAPAPASEEPALPHVQAQLDKAKRQQVRPAFRSLTNSNSASPQPKAEPSPDKPLSRKEALKEAQRVFSESAKRLREAKS